MTTPSHSVCLTPWDYCFRALAVLSIVLYLAAVYDNIFHSFASVGTYGLSLHYYSLFLITPIILLVSMLIIWRAPGNAVGPYLLLLGLGSLGWQFSYELGSPQVNGLAIMLFYLFWYGLAFPALIYLMVSFPTGAIFPARWARPVLVFAVVKFLGVLVEDMSLSPTDSSLGNVLKGNPNPFFVPQLASFQFVIFATVGSSGLLFLLGVIGGFASILLRYRASSPRERQQIRWVAWSFGILAVSLVVITLVGVVVESSFSPFNAAVANEAAGAIFLTAGLILIISFGVAVLRHRLFDIDLIINRTLVYVPLTAMIAGIFAASILLSQRLFVALTGQRSDVATAFATLITVTAFEPLKTRLQAFVDKRFKEAPNPAKRLDAFGEHLRSVIQVFDREQTSRRFLEEATTAFDASGGAVYSVADGKSKLVYSVGSSKSGIKFSLPIKDAPDDSRFLEIEMGARKNGTDYSERDRATLERNAALVVRALELAERANAKNN